MTYNDLILVLVTAPDSATAETLATTLLEHHFVACVNILPKITSIYTWKGKIERADEVLMVIKTQKERFADLERMLEAQHPYETPEIIAIAPSAVSERYLNWVIESTSTKT